MLELRAVLSIHLFPGDAVSEMEYWVELTCVQDALFRAASTVCSSARGAASLGFLRGLLYLSMGKGPSLSVGSAKERMIHAARLLELLLLAIRLSAKDFHLRFCVGHCACG